MKAFRAIFCPKRALSVLMFLYFLHGEQHQIRLGGWAGKQGHRCVTTRAGRWAFKKVFLEKEVLCFSWDTVGPLISSSRQWSTMLGTLRLPIICLQAFPIYIPHHKRNRYFLISAICICDLWPTCYHVITSPDWFAYWFGDCPTSTRTS